MLENDFYPIEFSYTGKGDYYNQFVDITGRYEFLICTDAVWLRRFSKLF